MLAIQRGINDVMVRKADPNTLSLRLEGEDLHPRTADPRVTLRIASAYFEALASVAASTGVELELEGCEIVDKCLSIESRFGADHRRAVILATELVAQYLDGRAKPARGTKRPIDELDRALGELTGHEACDVYVDDERFRLVAPVADNAETSRALTTLRCVVIRSGGERPRARFRAPGEERAFVLDCESKHQAAELGHLLYREVDAEVLLVRDLTTGFIVGGDVRGFLEVPVDEDPIAAWRNWYAPLASAWSEVVDLDAEIGRMRYGEDDE